MDPKPPNEPQLDPQNTTDLPPVDPVGNLQKLLYKILAAVLLGFPYIVAGIFVVFFLIIAFLFGLFPGS